MATDRLADFAEAMLAAEQIRRQANRTADLPVVRKPNVTPVKPKATTKKP